MSSTDSSDDRADDVAPAAAAADVAAASTAIVLDVPATARPPVTRAEVLLQLTWDDVRYRVPLFKGGLPGVVQKTKARRNTDGPLQTHRELLRGLHGSVRPGEMLAIMGSSGAGKTTLLDMLAGRIKGKNVSGSILINGEDFKKFSNYVAYVQQDDALFPLMTVTESLMYSAKLRLPSSWSNAQRRARVEEVIDTLGLRKVAKSKIGNEAIRGVSGGERRRVSIGMELVVSPSLLFLDEPTSGLDSFSAHNVVSALAALAKAGRTIVFTIHQPSSVIFQMFDRVMFLAEGQVVYNAQAAVAHRYFKRIGFPVPAHSNPADHILETTNLCQAAGKLPELVEAWNKHGLDYQPPSSSANLLTPAPASGPEAAEEGRANAVEMTTASAAYEPAGGSGAVATAAAAGTGGARDKRNKNLTNSDTLKSKKPGFLMQTWILTLRNFRNTLRTPELFIARLMTTLFMGFIIGTLFVRSGWSHQVETNRQVASYAVMTIALIFFPSLGSLPVFLEQKSIFKRERGSKYFKLIPYTLALDLSTLPFLLLLAVAYTVLTYWVVGLDSDPLKFFYLLTVIFLTFIIGWSYALFLSVLFPDFGSANAAGSAILAIMFLFSGFFIPRSDIPGYYIWIHYLSLFTYPMTAILVNQYDDLSPPTWLFPTDCHRLVVNATANITSTIPSCAIRSTRFPRDIYGIDPLPLYAYLLIMIAFILFLRFVFYILLRFRHKAVRK